MDEMTNKRTMPPADQPADASLRRRPAATPRNPKSSGGKMAIIIALCLLVVGGAVWLARNRTAGAEKKGPGARPMELPPVPVVAGTVVQKDVPIYLNGIATVQAFNTVTVRARVDGQVTKIAFTEGQDVHAGDLLAQIDPDPLPRGAGTGGGQESAGRSPACQRAHRPEPLFRDGDQWGVTQQQYDTQKALVNTLGRDGQRRPGGHRERQGPACLHHDRLPD